MDTIEEIRKQRLSAALNAIAVARNVTPEQVWETYGHNEKLVMSTWARVRRERNQHATHKPRSTLCEEAKPQRRNWYRQPPTPQERKWIENKDYWKSVKATVEPELEPLPTEIESFRHDPRQ